MVMAMLALAIGGDTISNQARREAIIDGLFDLPSKFQLFSFLNVLLECIFSSVWFPISNLWESLKNDVSLTFSLQTK